MPSNLKHVAVRLNDEDYEYISKIAEMNHISRSKVFVSLLYGDDLNTNRKRIDRQMERQQEFIDSTNTINNQLSKIDSDLFRMGNNLNQIARALNQQMHDTMKTRPEGMPIEVWLEQERYQNRDRKLIRQKIESVHEAKDELAKIHKEIEKLCVEISERW